MEKNDSLITEVPPGSTTPAGESAVVRRHRRRPARTTTEKAAAAAAPTDTPPVESAPAETPARPAPRRRAGRTRAPASAEGDAMQSVIDQAITPIVETVTEPVPYVPSMEPILPALSPMSQVYVNGKSTPPAPQPVAAPPAEAGEKENGSEEAHAPRRYRFDRRFPAFMTGTQTTPQPTPAAPAPEPVPASRRAKSWQRAEPAPSPEPVDESPERALPFAEEAASEPVPPESVAPESGIEVAEEMRGNGADAGENVSRRRRRRRGRGGSSSLPAALADLDSAQAAEEDEEDHLASAPEPQLAPPPTFAPQRTTDTPAPSPYGSPEPMYARGFGPAPRGVATELRPMPAPRTRGDRDSSVPISPNQLAAIITEAIQQQTDRLLNDQRRQAAAPIFTVAFPSTERVGVFVDVANLLYSSRSMRIPIDFGRLLTFLRGDRRLMRAHAYCPTSPEPYADQQFLQAVKGLGYRITTKDYKTFSSGAKKADLDLDLCMDIVRIVDAGAVDTIVLVSGDSDFLPLLEYCSDHGVRVEVAAFDESTAAILRQSCDLFINLSLVEEIRA
jgi:uncharacterized LabA/DUF88 family protein